MRRFACIKFQITTTADSKLSYTPCYTQCGLLTNKLKYMFWNKKKKLKEKREKEYFELNKKFQDKHQIVANWYSKKYLFGNHNGMQPVTEEGFEYQRMVKSFFGDNCYGQLPHSFSGFPYLNQSNEKDFDYYPVEKLMELYNQIEIIFPEPFLDALS
jgi:hypothetical protein